MTDAHGVDAYAVIVVRLDGEAPSVGGLVWRRWYEIGDAAEDGFDAQAWRHPDQKSPHKQLPTENRLPYFTPNVQQLLFPGEASGSHPTRWLCCPSDLWLDVGHQRANCRRARIDLLGSACSYHSPFSEHWTNPPHAPLGRQRGLRGYLEVVERSTPNVPTSRGSAVLP